MAKRTSKDVAADLRLKEGNIARTLSLNGDNYHELQRRALDLSQELSRRVSASEIVDILIEGYLNGKYKINVL